MTTKNSLAQALHAATHAVPGTPQHQDLAAGHQGPTAPNCVSRNPRHDHSRANGAPRSPRILIAWQNRIAALLHRGAR